MDTKTCSMCNIEKYSNNFYKNYTECKNQIVQEDWNVTMILKIKNQINKNYIMKK